MSNEKDLLKEIEKQLSEPFKTEEIEWRILRSFKHNSGAGGYASPYVQSRAIMSRLDQVLGLGGWENEYKEMHSGIICGIRIYLPNGKSLIKWDGADLTNYEATKGGLSSAFKRAAVHWGIGRYLYKIPEQYVLIYPDTKQGNNYINDNKNSIKGSWNNPVLPNWAIPSNESKVDSREELNKKIYKLESELGLTNNPIYISAIFGKANNTDINLGLNYVRNASPEELIKYIEALKPVYQLTSIRKKYNFSEKEFLKFCQMKIPAIQINEFNNLFFNVNEKIIKDIKDLCILTCQQRNQKVS